MAIQRLFRLFGWGDYCIASGTDLESRTIVLEFFHSGRFDITPEDISKILENTTKKMDDYVDLGAGRKITLRDLSGARDDYREYRRKAEERAAKEGLVFFGYGAHSPQ